MSELTKLSELDIVLISYDEENADKHWADLLEKVPWAKRVHGVEGSDAAHKAAARLSSTSRFISVDADNIVDSSFFDQEINFEHPKFKDKVVSWASKNGINHLEYGNGGLKCWPVDYVLNMKTHEAAEDDKNQIDFCWEDSYVQMNNRYCENWQNGSPRQAWRAGFREGVKMSLDRGKKVNISRFENSIWWGNYHRLLVWMTIGADIEHGLWAIYGARQGCYMTNLTDWDFVNVRDFTWLNDFWQTEVAPKFTGTDIKCHNSGYSYDLTLLNREIEMLGNALRKEMNIDLAEFNELQSKFFKKTYVGLPRTGQYVTEAEMNELRKINK